MKRDIGSRRGPAAALAAAGLALALSASCAGAPAAPAGEAKPDAFSSVSRLETAARAAPAVAELPAVEAPGKVLVVYYTSGNASERVAKDLADLFGADVERVFEKKARAGFFGFWGAGADSTFGRATRIETPRYDPAAYDRVFVLTPVWAWKLSPPIRSWLRMHAGKLPPVAFGTVSGDTEPEKIVAEMAKEAKRDPFAYAGFSEYDFKPENRSGYLAKIRRLAGL